MLVAVTLIMLHTPGGQPVEINPRLVTSLHHKLPGEDNKLITDDANCVVMLADGKFVAVTESCYEVRKLMESKQ
jgi:hypothetical protein